jgi:uncharacterized protein (DUF1800 family)
MILNISVSKLSFGASVLGLAGVLAVPAIGQMQDAMDAPAQPATAQVDPGAMAPAPGMVKAASGDNGGRSGNGGMDDQTQMRPPAQHGPLAPVPPSNALITPDEQILQILNRFTYGPRPGDLERVKAMGINEWLKQQFHPQTIDDSALDKRLADFPAMNIPLNKLMDMYPRPGVVKAMAQGRSKVIMPGGDAERAIYAAQLQREEERKKRKDGSDGGDDPKPLPDSMRDPAVVLAMDPQARFHAIVKLTGAQVMLLRHLIPEDRKSQLTAGFTPQQVETLAAIENPSQVISTEILQTKLLRDIYSERQLQEVMVDFWLNHFNVYIKKSQEAPYYITSYERDSIRPYALGRFEDLLRATAMSPAMLNYLDNSSSIGPHSLYVRRENFKGRFAKGKQDIGLNENYAREVMELHTLGVNGGYTQKDVTEVAKVFTGWTVDTIQGQDQKTQAQFDILKHEPGTKHVLGVTIKDNDEKEGYEVLSLLANSPATAKFICHKLAVRFVSDDPPKALEDRMVARWIETHGDIRQVLLTIIASHEFYTRGVYRAKVKTPQDYVISAVRASGADVLSTGSLVAALNQLGMPVYGMLTPNGYSMSADAWNNTQSLVARMNFALALSTNRVDGVKMDWASLLGASGSSMTAEGKDHVLEDKLLHSEVSDRTRNTILAQLAADPAQREQNLRQIQAASGGRDALTVLRVPRSKGGMGDEEAALAAGLLFGSPEFQRR